jgi:uncharacterized membrane protein YdjX (TVP38/TMEM64 family)
MERSTLMRLCVAALLVALLAVAMLYYPQWEPALLGMIEWLRELGPWGGLVVIAIYVPASVLMLPTWPITWSAGLIFGVLPGIVIASTGATAGVAAAFLVSRYLARDWARRKFAHHPLFAALDRAVAEQGLKLVVLTRLSPAFPYNLINYLYGLTSIPFRTYCLGSWLGMMPVIAMHVYLGAALKDVAEMFHGRGEGGPAQTVMLVVGIVATVAATVVLARATRKALAEILPTQAG